MTLIDITLKSDLSVERRSRRPVSLARRKDSKTMESGKSTLSLLYMVDFSQNVFNFMSPLLGVMALYFRFLKRFNAVWVNTHLLIKRKKILKFSKVYLSPQL